MDKFFYNLIKSVLEATIKWLQSKYATLYNNYLGDLPYNSLSPIDNAEIENDYKKALDWALRNKEKKDIKNIALTGPYGSGKSSILKTYANKYSNYDLQFLFISLATFKEEEEDNPKGDVKESLLRLIELSILQQIFYHEDDKRIPDSRFRKIKTYTKRSLVITTLCILALIVAILLLIYPNLPENLFNITIPKKSIDLIRYISFGILSIGGFILVYKSIRILNGVKISKLNIQNTEIEIDKGVSKSILNHHIDEILYFFEVTNYNVVVIEDLDRFKQTEIFTKLREINLLINNSKKIKKHVVFIYAVRDDMFREKNERTKFFDFIIPVIPIINPSNSGQKFLEKQSLYKYEISEDLIDSISLFIDDMRLLDNIFNEFYLYQQKLQSTLNQNKLLAIIVYKNLFPYDFNLLNDNAGVLYNAISKKQSYIKDEVARLDNQIELLKDEIKELEKLKITSIKELRYLYLLFYIPTLPGFVSFKTKGTDKSFQQMTEDENFELLISNKGEYKYFQQYSSQTERVIPTKFNQVEKNIDNFKTYEERRKQIEDWNNNKIEALKQKIYELEIRKSKARNLKIRDLIQQIQIEIESKDPKQKKLISILLRNGYIDEDYFDFVSIFYEGSLTKADFQFLINIKSQVDTSFDFKLNKVEKLIEKINPFEFEKKYVFNYALLDYLLNTSAYKSNKDKLFIKLSDESKESLDFINGFIDVTENIDSFIKLLVSKWTNIFEFIEGASHYTEERKILYLKLILNNSELNQIQNLYQNNKSFKTRLIQADDISNLIIDINKTKNIIKLLNIKFENLNLKNSPQELIDFIYEGNFYKINYFMVHSLIEEKGTLVGDDFTNRNYFAIGQSKCEHLIAYVEANINDYVEDLYLKLESNQIEEDNYFIQLLNNEKIDFEEKIKLIAKVETKIEDLKKLTDIRLIELLLKEAKIASSWDNIIYSYELSENKISDSIITFFETNGHADQLSRDKIKIDAEGERKLTDFIINLLTTEKFSDAVYESILKSIPYIFHSLRVELLTKSKVVLLIKYNILIFSNEYFNSLKESHPDLHINFLELNKSKFLKVVSDFDLDEDDILKILQSNIFTSEEKNNVIESVSQDLIIVNNASVKVIGELILINGAFRITDLIAKILIVNNSLTIEQRIRIHNWKHNQIDIAYYDTFLDSLGEPYSDITIRGKRPLLADTDYNLKLADILDIRNYISMYSIEPRGIRIITFRNSNEDQS